MLARLNAVNVYPGSARARRQQGVAMLHFAIDRRGGVPDVAQAQSSGFALLDREALALPRRASPLSAPPDDMRGERIELQEPVEFYSERHDTPMQQRKMPETHSLRNFMPWIR